jgi:hypothetical protein
LFKVIVVQDELPRAFTYLRAEAGVLQQGNGVPGKFLRGIAHQKMNAVLRLNTLRADWCCNHRQSRGHRLQYFYLDPRPQPKRQQRNLHAREKGLQIGHKASYAHS